MWVHTLFFLSTMVCLIFGLVHFFRGPLDTPLAISLIFMVYNIIPQYLLLQVRPGSGFWMLGRLCAKVLRLKCDCPNTMHSCSSCLSCPLFSM